MDDRKYIVGRGQMTQTPSINDCCEPSLADARVQMPLVEHLATINGRLERIEGTLEIIQNWIVGPRPECAAECSSGEPNLESQIYRAERIASRIDCLVNEIRVRIS